jgi:hypothetical protein
MLHQNPSTRGGAVPTGGFQQKYTTSLVPRQHERRPAYKSTDAVKLYPTGRPALICSLRDVKTFEQLRAAIAAKCNVDSNQIQSLLFTDIDNDQLVLDADSFDVFMSRKPDLKVELARTSADASMTPNSNAPRPPPAARRQPRQFSAPSFSSSLRPFRSESEIKGWLEGLVKSKEKNERVSEVVQALQKQEDKLKLVLESTSMTLQLTSWFLDYLLTHVVGTTTLVSSQRHVFTIVTESASFLGKLNSYIRQGCFSASDCQRVISLIRAILEVSPGCAGGSSCSAASSSSSSASPHYNRANTFQISQLCLLRPSVRASAS